MYKATSMSPAARLRRCRFCVVERVGGVSGWLLGSPLDVCSSSTVALAPHRPSSPALRQLQLLQLLLHRAAPCLAAPQQLPLRQRQQLLPPQRQSSWMQATSRCVVVSTLPAGGEA